MPFWYDLQLGERNGRFEFIRPLVPDNSWLKPGMPIALLSVDGGYARLKAFKSGLLSRWHVAEGAALSPTTPIARIIAEGEDMPYGTQPEIELLAEGEGLAD